MNILSRLHLIPSPPSAPKSRETFESLWKLSKLILDSLNFSETVNKIVNGVLNELDYFRLGYKIVVLCLPDEGHKVLLRIAASQTPETHQALSALHLQLQDINIPFTETDNYCIKCFQENKPFITHNWNDIFRPIINEEQARNAQQVAKIKTSMIFPVIYHQKTAGVMIFSVNKDEEEISQREKELILFFTDIVGLAVQNSKLYTTLNTTTKDLTDANTKLQELDKLKDEFVSLASHELRTPMTAIKGSLSTILEGYAGDISPQSREFLVAAYNENDRLLRLVNNLLNISRIEAGRFQIRLGTVKYGELVHDVIANLEPVTKEKHLYLKYEPDGPVPDITADPDLIREVLINIIGNALKFTHQGGVTVKTTVKDGFVTTSIADTGSGIAKEDWDLLFKKFSQVHGGGSGSYARPTGGTGLGLYICKQIIEGHQGRIWLESTLYMGSTFFFTLPLAMKSGS